MTLTQLRQEIANLINTSDLPIDGVYFVMKDLLNEITDVYTQWIKNINNAAAGQVETDEVKEEEADAAAQNREEEK